jgi:hypothetical protein
MKLLAIQAQQYGPYYLPRYRQADEYREPAPSAVASSREVVHASR